VIVGIEDPLILILINTLKAKNYGMLNLYNCHTLNPFISEAYCTERLIMPIAFFINCIKIKMFKLNVDVS